MEKVFNYDDYMNILTGRGDTFVFRGQANSSFILIPSGLRGKHIKVADSQMFEFVDEMKALFGFDELTCIEFAQHFALPTRMLDFSYSYDVALFFACYEQRGRYKDCDGKVFIFNKSKYERMLRERGYLSSQITRNNKILYEWLEKYVEKDPTSNKGLDMPIFVDATQQFDRLFMQKGLFLLWGKDECSFEQILIQEGLDINDFIDTITIAQEAKPKILEYLASKNITEDTLYMNVSRIKDLVTTIKEKEQQEA